MRTSKQLTFWNFLKITLALLLAGLVLSELDLRQLPELFSRISIPWLLLSTTLFLLMTLVKAFQYYALISARVTYPQVLNIVVLQNSVSNFLASGMGIASYLAMLQIEHGVKPGRAMSAFLLTKVGDLIVLWLALAGSAVLVWAQIEQLHMIVLGLLIALGLIIVVFLCAGIFRKKFSLFASQFVKRFGLAHLQVVQKVLTALTAISEIELGRFFGILARICLTSLIYFIVSVAWYYSTYVVFDFKADLSTVIFINVLLQLISYFPIQVFGGLGVTETSSLYFWGMFGVASFELAPTLVGIRVLFYLMNLLPLVYLPVYTLMTRKEPDQ